MKGNAEGQTKSKFSEVKNQIIDISKNILFKDLTLRE